MPRTVDLWIALLGIMRSGAAYLPLERDWPRDRLQYMHHHSDCVAVVCDHNGHTPDFVPPSQRIPLVDDSPTTFVDLPLIQPGQPAYVIYTSGSTGKPKGVVVSHGSLMNLLAGMADMLRLSPDDRQLCITALSFDLVVPDLFLPLTVGACCVMASRTLAADAVLLADRIESESITVLQATPHTYKRILASGWQGRSSLRAVIGGERVPRTLAHELAKKVGALWHCYGPTETTVWATARCLREGQEVTLGGPLPGYVLKVIDAQALQVGDAGEGELYIGGDGVALGYLNDPDLTAGRFVELPGETGRFYRTGDLVRRDAAGNLTFLGRADEQVKVGGYRVEPGEIESVAQSLDGIEDAAAVIDTGDDNGGITLYYTTGESAGSGVESAMRERFASGLPWYMVPSHIIQVPRMPLTPGGKIDRRTLATMSGRESSATGPLRLQDELLRLWQELFPERRVSVTDNFFDLGGDSLTAVRLLTAIDQILHRDLTLSFVYAYPTVALMAQRLAAEDGFPFRGDGRGENIICLRPGEAMRLYCFHPVGGSVMHYRALLDYVPPELGVYGIEAPTLDGVTEPAVDMPSMAAAYAELIAADGTGGPYLLAGGSMGGVTALAVARCLTAMGHEVRAVLMFDSFGPDAIGDGATGNAQKGPMTATRLAYSAGQRIKNWMQLARGRLRFRMGKPLPHAWRYRFIELHNHEILRHYFATEDSRQPWPGKVIMIRVPLATAGVYALPLLGWDAVFDSAQVTVEYVDGRHDRLVESPSFGNALLVQLELLVSGWTTGLQ